MSILPPELLAPAGSPEALIAAVNAGADAVYLGGKQFGARASAPNFTDDELAEAISYAHLRGARVYVTVNTLVHDRELPLLARFLVMLYGMGADGILLQDAGGAVLAHSVVPDLPRHASTQCTITDPEGVMQAHEAGFARVVIARELGMREIDAIFEIPETRRPGIEIFVHGALCYAYSGQCLLSSVIGGRSGNRGMCAQPCRKPYRLLGGVTDPFGRIHGPERIMLEEKFLLSTRDLCLYPRLGDVLKRPFAALKIEGRMRSPEYGAIVVSRYRKAIDSIVAGSFMPRPEDIEELEIAFSRGFSTGYLFGDRGPALMGRCRPGNRGLFLGSVVFGRPGELKIIPEARTVPGPGDGLVGRDPKTGEEQGFILRGTVERTDREMIIRQQTGVRTGMDLFLTRSSRLEREAAAILQAPGPAGRFPLPIDITLTVEPGLPLLISGSITVPGGSTLMVRHEGNFTPELARERPTTGAEIARQIRKTGESAFRVGEFSLTYPGGLFIPVGKLNTFRREFLDIAKQAVLASRRPGSRQIRQAEARAQKLTVTPARHHPPQRTLPRLAVICDDRESLAAALSAGADRVFFEPAGDCHVPGEEIRAELRGAAIPGAIIWKWPQVSPPGFIAKGCSALPGLQEAGLSGVMVDGPGAAAAIRRTAPGTQITGGPGLNIFNHLAVCAYRYLFSAVTLSPELSARDIAELQMWKAASCPGMGIGVLVQGNIEAMITADNLRSLVPGGDRYASRRFGLEDATGRVFPVHVDCYGRSHIANASELCIIDYLPDLAAYGVNSVIIDARTRGAAYTGGMTAVYREALGKTAWMTGKPGVPGLLPVLKERIREMARGGITTGHYVRGLAEE